MVKAQKDLWTHKLLWLLHDPPHKVFRIKGHANNSLKHAQVLAPHSASFKNWKRIFNHKPDTEAASADRIALVQGKPLINWVSPKQAWVTHPLGGEALFFELSDPLSLLNQSQKFMDDWIEVRIPEENASREPLQLEIWRNLAESFRDAFKDQLGYGWHLIPADSRTPDHSIWDHCHLASAQLGTESAYHSSDNLATSQNRAHLLVVKLTGIQNMIAESRKMRDLWISSYLLADLAWAAIRPVVEMLGPDAILYPSLHGNPLADQWLHARGITPSGQETVPTTFVSTLPNKFVALVPHAAIHGPDPLCEKIEQALQARWDELQQKVFRWIEAALQTASKSEGTSQWQAIWHRQLAKARPGLRWVALPWSAASVKQYAALEKVLELAELEGPEHGVEVRSSPHPNAAKPKNEWDRHTAIWKTQLDTHRYLNREPKNGPKSYLEDQRLFLYPALHHEASMRLNGLSMLGFKAQPEAEYGPKCHVDRCREALRFDAPESARFAELKKKANAFWSIPAFQEDKGEIETLSAVSAFKRFLIRAEAHEATMAKSPNHANSARASTSDAVQHPPLSSRFSTQTPKGDPEPRAPFPPLFLVTNAAWLSERLADEERVRAMVEPLEKLINFLRREKIPETQRIQGYPSLERLLVRVLKIDERAGQRLSEFLGGPGKCGWDLRYLQLQTFKTYFRKNPPKKLDEEAPQQTKKRCDDLLGEAKKLLDALLNALGDSPPATHFAVLKMDGDLMGQLLLGLQGRIPAAYKDVVHPVTEAFIRTEDHFKKPAWTDLLEEKRLMTPSLHAFVSRALGHFAYEVAPYLVEWKYNGRLIYAGGDDLLAFVPASEALALAEDLRRAFSSAWLKGDWRHESRPDPNQEDQLRPGQGIAFPDPSERTLLSQRACFKPKPQERWFPQLGQAGWLSASIVYAHFKSPLQPLLRHSQNLLDEVAKSTMKRGALALSRLSRGGEKNLCAFKWREDPAALACLESLRRSFRASNDGQNNPNAQAPYPLSGRLPYKLQACLSLLKLPKESAEQRQLRDGLLKGALSQALESRREPADGRPQAADGQTQMADKGANGRDPRLSDTVAQLLKAIELGENFQAAMQRAGGEASDPFVVLLFARFLAKELEGEA